MKDLFPHIDIHSHDLSRRDSAVINIQPGDEMMCGVYYSVGIHPWNACESTDESLLLLEQIAADNRVVAIGETGLDALKGGPLAVQQALFERHIKISEQVGKPLIIHAVRTLNLVMVIKRELCPKQPWIIHGFRGKPQQAQELLKHGFYLSLGEKFNPLTAAVIPSERLFYESDESVLPIAQIIKNINEYRE